MMLVASGLAALVLVVIAALLSASESALGLVSRADLNDLAEESRRPGALPAIARDIEAHTNAATFSRVACETIAAVLIAVALVQTLDNPWLAILVASGIMLLVGFVVTGSSPRSIGRAHPRATLKLTNGLVRTVRLITGPVADLLVTIGDVVTPGRPARDGALTSEEQLLSMVDDATEREVLDEEDRDLIHSVIDFGDRLVREVMVARTDMITLDAATTVADALRELLAAGISRAPVVGRDADDVLGVAYLKDLMRHSLAPDAVRQGFIGDPASSSVVTVARPAEFVPESVAAETLLRRMRDDRIHFAIVVDEYGGVAGLVTLEDLIEELVGEIDDEFDRAQVPIEWLDSRTVRVPSRMATGELGELFDVDLEFDDVDSVGGLLGRELGKIPDLGDSVELDGLEFIADRIGRKRRVTAVIVRQLDDNRSTLDESIPDDLARVLDGRRSAPHKEDRE